MDKDAESRKNIYKTLNELDGPLFKISKDPRLTWIGKLLVKNGLDELPQLLNIAKGEMSFVGPRPFPIDEAKMIEKKYDKRYSVMPGLTGTWVLKGFHKLSFKKWMELDLEYVNSKNIWYDVVVIIRTIRLLLKM